MSIEEVLGKKISSIKELRDEIKRLQDSMLSLDSSSEEYKSTAQQVAAAQEALRNITKGSVSDNIAAKDSVLGMEQAYKSLYNQYKLLSEEQRNSSFGKQMAEDLKGLSEKLNDTKQGVGNFKDNIGQYTESVSKAFQGMGISINGLQKPMQLASNGIKGFGKSLKALAANPVGLAMMAIVVAVKALVAIFKKAKEAINQNEESQMRLKEAMASFQPIIDAVNNAFDWLGQKLVSVVEFVAKFVDKLRMAGAAIKDFFAGNKGATKDMKEQQDIYKDIAKSSDNLIKSKREAKKLNSSQKAEVEALREQASATQDAEEKIRILNEAKAIQEEIDQRNIALAEEELRILNLQSGLTANNAEMNERLADAQARVSEATATAARNQRELNGQLKEAQNQVKKTSGGYDELRKRAKELQQQLIDDNKTEIQLVTEKYQEEKKLLEKYHMDTTLLTKKYNKDIAEINAEQTRKQLKNERETRERINEEYNKFITDELRFRKAYAKFLEEPDSSREKSYFKLVTLDLGEAVSGLTALDAKMGGTLDKAIIKARQINADIESGARNIEDISEDEMPTEEVQNAIILIDRLSKTYGIQADNLKTLKAGYYETKVALRQLNDQIKENEKNRNITEYSDRLFNGKGGLKEMQENLYELLNMDFTKEDSTNFMLGYDKLVKNRLKYANKTQVEAIEEETAALLKRKELDEKTLAQIEDSEEYSAEYKAQVRLDLYNTIAELNEKMIQSDMLAAERTRQVWEDSFSSFDTVTNSMNSVISTYSQLAQAQIQDGKLTEEEAKKKIKTLQTLEKVQLGVSIANIVASNASAIMDVWRGYSSELQLNAETAASTGPAAVATKAALDAKSLTSAILRTTGIAAQATAQIVAAKSGYVSNMNSLSGMMESGSGGAVSSVPSIIDSTPYTYTQEIQDIDKEDALNNRPIWVSVTDINNMMNQVKVVDQESSF